MFYFARHSTAQYPAAGPTRAATSLPQFKFPLPPHSTLSPPSSLRSRKS